MHRISKNHKLRGTTKTILVFGTFDTLHPGHRWFLRHSAALGDRIVAVVARDDFAAYWKGQAPISNEESRMTALMDSGLVDQAVLADEEIHTYGVLREFKPDIVCLGHDQKSLKDDIESYLESIPPGESRPQIHVLPPWRRRRYSSTRINQTKNPWETRILRGLAVLAVIPFGFQWLSGRRWASKLPESFIGYGAAFGLNTILICVLTGAYGAGLYFLTSTRLGSGRGNGFAYLLSVLAAGFIWAILDGTSHSVIILGGALASITFVLISIRWSHN